jgi:large subunit ribosomal protein L22
MTVKARLRHTRLAPQKARLVADMIRGKNVTEAMNVLTFTRKKAAREIQALLKSALANAEENHKVVDVEDMFVEKITVDEGVAWKRQMPRARGMANQIKKRTSHVTIVLNEK